MAETVELHIENMLPELEQMRRIGLFKQEEINEVIKRRKDFEYKIERTMKEKHDFLRYINYEVKLLREIKIRRDKSRISEKKTEIEYAIAKRVVKLYQLALTYFKHDVRLWESYINFCTQTKFSNVVSQAFKQMLQVHGDKKHLWLFASKWEICESNNIEGALNYLKTGLHRHPDAPELYTEAIRLELKSVENATDKDNEEELKEKAVRRAAVHFRAALTALGNDVQFIVSLLAIVTEFDFTQSLQNEIIEYLTANCWKSELMWHTMAQRELRGLNYSKSDMHKSTRQLCISVYKAAIKVLPTVEMWEKYLDTLIEIYYDEKKNKNFKTEILEKCFENAYESGFLLEKHYLIWLDILEGDAKYEEVLSRANKSLPKSVELWLMRLHHHTKQDNAGSVDTIAQQAIKSLGPNALQIYRMLIKYYQIKNGNNTFTNECKRVFEEGIARSEPEISLPLRPQYIEWITVARSIKFGREEYEKLVHKLPYCLDLHRKMVDLEMVRFTPSLPIIRNIYKTACSQFGKEKTDIWMEYIKFELDHGDPRNVPGIYNLAKNTLKENLVSIFTTDYAILNSQ